MSDNGARVERKQIAGSLKVEDMIKIRFAKYSSLTQKVTRKANTDIHYDMHF